MRRIVLDTETTGLEFRLGDRIIEIGCVELVGRKLSGQRFHRYVNPGRDVEAGALSVHGITNEFLQDKPTFAQIAAELADFIRNAELVIHNAAFDVGFLNNELALAELPPLEQLCTGVLDTLKLARELHPGRKNSLDALCDRYAIDNSQRTLHGALLDAELLAEVYLAMTRGQESLLIDLEHAPSIEERLQAPGERPPLLILWATDEELSAHDNVLQEIARQSKGRCLWLGQPVPAVPD